MADLENVPLTAEVTTKDIELGVQNEDQPAAFQPVAAGAVVVPKPNLNREKPEVLFQWKLKENDGCCTSWCAAHFFLIWLILELVTQIAISSYHITVLQDPYGEHWICYDTASGHSNSDLDPANNPDCYDARELYEDFGLSVPFLSVVIAFCCLYFVVCMMGFYALHKCVPWIFLTLWIFLNLHIVFMFVHSILTGIYWGFCAMVIPMMLSCYFWMIYVLVRSLNSDSFPISVISAFGRFLHFPRIHDIESALYFFH